MSSPSALLSVSRLGAGVIGYAYAVRHQGQLQAVVAKRTAAHGESGAARSFATGLTDVTGFVVLAHFVQALLTEPTRTPSPRPLASPPRATVTIECWIVLSNENSIPSFIRL